MHRNGHIGAGLLVYAPIGSVLLATGAESFAVVGGMVAIGLSVLPDVDEFLSGYAHRGPTHTIWFVVLCSVVVGTVASAGLPAWGLSRAVIWGLFTAVALSSLGSHLLVDAVTPMGIRPFLPVHSAEYSLQWTKSANPRANLVLLGLGVLASGLAIALGTL